ncbi:TPA: RusA family crossover junction endodeoxyribonuclease [Pasteurella multocida]|nr:RusA family crossover junction endodeoxyribonuclease [Pasteurella multocida]HDR1833799.1 RusA family crossover junction endodeoxyribonuclease [Pasteurella multocida]
MLVNGYQLVLELPFPPTVNTYWRRVGNSTKISEKGRKYARDIAWLTRGKRFPEDKRASVFVEAFMPDGRKRDIDNLLKALLDSLVKAGVLVDDSIVDELRIVRRKVVKNGLVRVHIGEWEDDNY